MPRLAQPQDYFFTVPSFRPYNPFWGEIPLLKSSVERVKSFEKAFNSHTKWHENRWYQNSTPSYFVTVFLTFFWVFGGCEDRARLYSSLESAISAWG